jgi:hypothetical protein
LCAHAIESLHVLNPIAEDVSPLLKALAGSSWTFEVGLDDLAREGAEAAAFLVRAFVPGVEGGPPPKRVDGVEAGELLPAMDGQDAFSLPADHSQDEALLGWEVVVELGPLTPAARRIYSLFVAWTPLA